MPTRMRRFDFDRGFIGIAAGVETLGVSDRRQRQEEMRSPKNA